MKKQSTIGEIKRKRKRKRKECREGKLGNRLFQLWDPKSLEETGGEDEV